MSGRYATGLLPIDYAILKALPKEGTELTEYVPLGTSVRALKKRIEGVSSDQLSARLRLLKTHGFTVPVRIMPVSLGFGWQHTEKAIALFETADRLGVLAAIDAVNQEIEAAKENGSTPETEPELPSHFGETQTQKEAW